MKKLLIFIIIVQSLVIVGGGFYIYKNYLIKNDNFEKKEPVENLIREKLEIEKTPKVEMKESKLEGKKISNTEKVETLFMKSNPKDTLVIDTPKTLPQVPMVEEKEAKEVKEEKSPTDIKVNVDINNIDIPKIGPEIGGGISASGSLALQQAYEEAHDLNKTIQLANEILKTNPNDQTAQKYKKLAELEIMANEALNKGDRQSALNYFYQMQSIDPNNKWARKGIMKIMSGG